MWLQDSGSKTGLNEPQFRNLNLLLSHTFVFFFLSVCSSSWSKSFAERCFHNKRVWKTLNPGLVSLPATLFLLDVIKVLWTLSCWSTFALSSGKNGFCCCYFWGGIHRSYAIIPKTDWSRGSSINVDDFFFLIKKNRSRWCTLYLQSIVLRQGRKFERPVCTLRIWKINQPFEIVKEQLE